MSQNVAFKGENSVYFSDDKNYLSFNRQNHNSDSNERIDFLRKIKYSSSIQKSKNKIALLEDVRNMIKDEIKFDYGNFLFKPANRNLYSKDFMEIEDYQNQMLVLEAIKSYGKDVNANLNFVKNRTLCLEALFLFIEFMKETDNTHDYRILKKKDYQNIKDNPLHFTFYWGDYHSTLLLLEKKHEMLFWENAKKRMPIHTIPFSGTNKQRAKAILVSILNEVTRMLNNKIISKIHLNPNNLKEDKDKDRTII